MLEPSSPAAHSLRRPRARARPPLPSGLPALRPPAPSHGRLGPRGAPPSSLAAAPPECLLSPAGPSQVEDLAPITTAATGDDEIQLNAG